MARRRQNIVVPVVSVEFGSFGKEPDAPESFTRSQSRPNLDWEGLYGAGENSNGFRAQQPNGTSHAQGNGSNRDDWMNRANGSRWSPPINWNAPGRRNRTGE